MDHVISLQYTHFSEDFKFAVIFPLVFLLSTCVSSQWLSQTSDTLAPSLQITCPSKRSSIYQAEKTLETSLWAGKSILYVHLLLSSWRNGLIIEGNLQYDLHEFILPLPLSNLLRYIVLINAFFLSSPNGDQRQTSPFLLWPAVGSTVWRNWQLIDGVKIC